MGVRVDESSEFRLTDALFWFEIDKDHMLWFVIENGALVAKTYSKSGVHVGQDRTFVTGLWTVTDNVAFVQTMADGTFLINYRDRYEPVPEKGWATTTYYNLYDSQGNLLRSEQSTIGVGGWHFELGYYDLTDGSHLQLWKRWTDIDDVFEFSIFDGTGNHVVTSYNFINESGGWREYYEDTVVLDGGRFAVFTNRYKGDSVNPDRRYQFEIFDSEGQSLGGEVRFLDVPANGMSFSTLEDAELNSNGEFVALHWSTQPRAPNRLDMLVFDEKGEVQSTVNLRSENDKDNGFPKIIDARLTNLEGGGWVATWGEGYDWYNVNKSDVRYFQMFDETGSAVSKRTLITGPDEWITDAIYPWFIVTPLRGGGFVASWLRANMEMDVVTPFRHAWMQRAYDADGHALTKEVQITDVGHTSYLLSVEALEDGGWRSTFADGQIKDFHVSGIDNAPINYDMRFLSYEDDLREFFKTDFMYFDADGDKIAGIRFTTLPESGEIVKDGIVLKVGAYVPWTDIAFHYPAEHGFYYRPQADLNGDDVARIGFEVVMENGGVSNEAFLEIDLIPKVDPPGSADFEITIKEDTHPAFTEDMFNYAANEGGDFKGVIFRAAYVKTGTYGLWTDYVALENLDRIPYKPMKNAFGEGYSTIEFQVVDRNGLLSDWYEIKVDVEEVMDTTLGTAARDIMEGIEGSNKLVGRGGNDVFRSGAYDDVYVGGRGRDTFVFVDGGGADRVKDFRAGEDIIDVSALRDVTNFGDLRSHMTRGDGDITIHFGGHDDLDNTLVIENVRIKDLTSQSFEF